MEAETVDPPVGEPSAAPSRPLSGADLAVVSVLAVLVWALVIAVGRVGGIELESQGRVLVLYTPPILGGYRPDEDALRFLVPLVLGLLLVAVLPPLARLRWRTVLAIGPAATLVWWVAVASVEGLGGLIRGLYVAEEYDSARPLFSSDLRQFLATFTDELPGYSVQVRGHPPGVPILLAGLDRIGLGGERWVAGITLVVAASAVVAVLIAVREVVDEDTARRAFPFLVLAPSATWMAVSFDALFAGVAAWFVALVVLAARRSGRRSDALAVGAGLLAAASIMFSYGLVLLGCVVIGVIVANRAWRTVGVVAATALAVTLAFVPLGFWWITGLEATRVEYETLAYVDRPYAFFLVANLSAWFLAIGPATVVALALLRDRRLWLLVGGGVAAVLVANLSGLSKAEVERIWLPFTVWVVPAAAVLGGRRWSTRGWLAAQAAVPVVLAWFIRAHW